MSSTEYTVEQDIEASPVAKPARKQRGRKLKEEINALIGGELAAKKTRGVKKSEKSKAKAKVRIAPAVNSYKLYKEYLKRLYESGDIPSIPKISHEAKIALDDKVAAYDIELFNTAATITEGVRRAKTLSDIDVYAALALGTQ